MAVCHPLPPNIDEPAFPEDGMLWLAHPLVVDPGFSSFWESTLRLAGDELHLGAERDCR
ncbi:hypothetical protein AVEN_86504-1, partial [Araneus ventricosus]